MADEPTLDALEAAALTAAMERRRHELTCSICAASPAPCKAGGQLIRRYFDTRRAYHRAMHAAAAAN